MIVPVRNTSQTGGEPGFAPLLHLPAPEAEIRNVGGVSGGALLEDLLLRGSELRSELRLPVYGS